MPRGKRSQDQTQISLSLPKALLDEIDELAGADNRSRSNWIVTVIKKAVALRLSQKNIVVLPAAADADDPSSSSIPSARVAEEPPQHKRK